MNIGWLNGQTPLGFQQPERAARVPAFLYFLELQ